MLLILFCQLALAASNVQGKYLPDGKILRFTITDTAVRPFEGGLLWAALKGASRQKSYRVKGLQIQCEKLRGVETRDYVANCQIQVERASLRDNRKYLVYSLAGAEASATNDMFGYQPFTFKLDIGENHEILANIDRRKNTFSLSLNSESIKKGP